MLSMLETAAVFVLLALAAAMVAMWSWLDPLPGGELDLRVVTVASLMACLGVAWALCRESEISADPEST